MNHVISRGVPLEDLNVKGRTVTAYAAVFDSPTEIRDQHGHYYETNHRNSFNKTLKEAGARAGYFYNHGMTIHGTPSDMGSIPLGASERISADSKGLLTVSRVSQTPMGDAILEAINDGAITGYSYTGTVYKSNPTRIPRVVRGGALPTVTRMEIGLREYGPTPFPAFVDAAITSVRSSLPFGPEGVNLSETDRAALFYDFLMRFTAMQPNALPTPLGAGTAEPTISHSDRNREEIRKRVSRSSVRDWNTNAGNPQG
jgi:HK97 family phage prohead protease